MKDETSAIRVKKTFDHQRKNLRRPTVCTARAFTTSPDPDVDFGVIRWVNADLVTHTLTMQTVQ